jgi:hypothetical protein
MRSSCTIQVYYIANTGFIVMSSDCFLLETVIISQDLSNYTVFTHKHNLQDTVIALFTVSL